MINDDELIKIFIEEARDILDILHQKLEAWSFSLTQKEIGTHILRELHTLKGSASMVDLLALHAYVHLLEKVVQKFQQPAYVLQENEIKKLQHAVDYLYSYIEACAKNQVPADEAFPLSDLHKLLNEVEPSDVIKTTEFNTENTHATKPLPKEMIRVNVDIIEKFSELSGQINVTRSNAEQQLKTADESLLEMTKKIKMIQEQTRQLQLKTDANITLFQNAATEKKYDEFDILEMDRYSLLQQTTRVLEDKLEQLEELHHSIIHSVRNAQSLLGSQKRSTKNLDQSITHTRLISIENLIPRLKRVVRQVSHELKKEVRLECTKIEGEVDRKIVQSIISPLEHMIRNSIDHGIEAPAIREKKGKPIYGTIMLSLFREGNEIIIQLKDDGQGINIDRVRKKAIEKKLWSPDVSMSKDQALKMILLPGFSTLDNLTSISGQGVGMDVVDEEVKKLGGLLQIETHANIGTEFTLRLPFKVTLNQALIFKVSKQTYALPLSSLAGLTRIPFAEVEKIKAGSNKISYAHKDYDLFNLVELLGDTSKIHHHQHDAIPIIFLLSQEHPIALVVDKLVGSSEIIIKPPGLQLQFIKEIYGVSLLADGKIVLILNPSALISRALEKRKTSKNIEDIEQKTKILVVDDSATVRKVTCGFLNRHHFEAMMAKDGVEALALMTENKPDIVLLDIEMPIMDGFQVIEKIRASAQLQNIPIIMMTSRSGEKHRIRALQMGANDYLTKPYIEEDLLSLLQKYEKREEI